MTNELPSAEVLNQMRPYDAARLRQARAENDALMATRAERRAADREWLAVCAAIVAIAAAIYGLVWACGGF